MTRTLTFAGLIVALLTAQIISITLRPTTVLHAGPAAPADVPAAPAAPADPVTDLAAWPIAASR